ncbi:MAG TPA: thioredoxin-like domain-containing protein [Chryseosolibacter sp.]|nr:thioredoxin-like domain-containing protein [Chryseosolibacter sp.]
MKSGLLTLLLIVSVQCFAQSGYSIRFKIDGLQDTTAYLGYYYGESTFVKDTAKVNHTGDFVFEGKQTLPQGVYFLVLHRTRIFELVVGRNQHFSMHTSTADYVKNMKVTGDLDNKLFFDNMIYNMERHQEAEPFIKVIQDSTLAEDKKKTAREAFTRINEKVMAYQQKVIDEHPTTLTARIFKANRPIQIPEPPKRADGSIDSTFQLRWYREHFFDNFDLADDALIRMPRPIYQEKINEYLDRLFAPQADTLIKALNKVIAKAKKNQETYKYAVWVATLKFQNPEIMGLDEVFVHLNDTYYASGEMNYWANDQMKKNMKEQADRLRKSLIGQKGSNLIMLDASLKPRALYDIKNKYTILYIFDPDCGSCKKETPKLVDFYNKKKFDVQVYAVSADTSMVKMRDYIKEMNMKWITVNGPRTYVGPYQDLYDANTTPTLYVLDNQKMIIGKKIPAEKLEEFLTQYERIQRAKASGKL